MHLDIPISTAKDIGHSGLGGRKVVSINFKLIP
jgi:hypothetical protein